VSVDADGSDTVVVTYSEPVTWNGLDPGTLIIGGDQFGWNSQLSPTQMDATSQLALGHGPGEPWTMPGPDPEISPEVQLPASGVTI